MRARPEGEEAAAPPAQAPTAEEVDQGAQDWLAAQRFWRTVGREEEEVQDMIQVWVRGPVSRLSRSIMVPRAGRIIEFLEGLADSYGMPRGTLQSYTGRRRLELGGTFQEELVDIDLESMTIEVVYARGLRGGRTSAVQEGMEEVESTRASGTTS